MCGLDIPTIDAACVQTSCSHTQRSSWAATRLTYITEALGSSLGWRSEDIAPRFYNLPLFLPSPFYFREKSSRPSFYRRLGGPQTRSWRGGEEKISLS